MIAQRQKKRKMSQIEAIKAQWILYRFLFCFVFVKTNDSITQKKNVDNYTEKFKNEQ